MRMRPLSWLIYSLLFPAVCLSTSCEMLKKSHYDYSTLLKKGPASDLKICTGKNACCTKNIEDEILESAEKIFKAQLEDKLIVLRHMINSNLNSFRTFFYNSLNACHEHLDTLFRSYLWSILSEQFPGIYCLLDGLHRDDTIIHACGKNGRKNQYTLFHLQTSTATYRQRRMDGLFKPLRAFSSPFSDAKVSQITGRLFE
ncbi:hypothetical protein OSTOST_12661 [Ostertagia ostertagi]